MSTAPITAPTTDSSSSNSTSSTMFTGTSRYSADLDQVVSRAVQIASLPITQLQSDVSALTDQATELGKLSTVFANLQTAVSGLDTAVESGSLNADVSDTSILNATVSAGATEGSVYSVEVTNAGAYTTTQTSAQGLAPQIVTDPSKQTISNSANPSYTLTVGSASGPATFSITPASNDLNSLADAINATSGANVTASVVNVGTSSAPDYRLSLVSTDPSATSIQLNDGSIDLETENTSQTFASAMSSAPEPEKVTDPSTQTISSQADPVYTLTVGPAGNTKSYAITPSTNTLMSLEQAINSTSAANVQASVVNVGSDAAPDYRLQLQSTMLGAIGIQLSDGISNLETQQGALGTLASYKVDGNPAVTSDSRTVALAPGLTVNLLTQSPAGVATNITVTRQGTPIADALNTFVTDYNAALDEVNTQRGQSGGALTGQSIVYQLSAALESINGYFAGGTGTSSLFTLGISMDKNLTGHMSFDQSAFMSTDFSDSPGVTNFLGDATTGGFLKNATDALNMVMDSTSGELTTEVNSVSTEITNKNSLITTQQATVATLQTNLTAQMAAADAAIATMEQQYNEISAEITAMMNTNQPSSTTG
jgi:flagellar hook-associated protein 2